LPASWAPVYATSGCPTSFAAVDGIWGQRRRAEQFGQRFSEALAALLGKDAPGLSPTAIARLKDGWLDECRKRDLSAKRYVYVWTDGIYLQARLEDEKQCILVLIGATSEGRKKLIGLSRVDSLQQLPPVERCRAARRHGRGICEFPIRVTGSFSGNNRRIRIFSPDYAADVKAA
jgi:hypothetical protein